MATDIQQLIREQRESEREARRSLLSRFTQEFGRGLGSFASDVVRAPIRGFQSISLSLLGKKELTPQTRGERFLYGKEPVRSVRETGEQPLREIGLGEKTVGKFGLPLGVALTGLDITPFGFGKKKVAEKGAKKLLQKSTKEFLKKQPKRTHKIITDIVKEIPDEVVRRRRGVLNNKKLIELSKGKIGALDELLTAPEGTILTGEANIKIRQELADKILQATTVREAVAEAKRTVPAVLGARAEVGRSLSSFKVNVRQGQDAAGRLLKMAEVTTDASEKQLLEQMAGFVAGKTRTPQFIDKLVEWATAIKLTSPLTQFRNIGGNTFSMMIKFPERFVSSGLDSVRAVLTGRSRERFAREVVADFIGTSNGMKEGARNAVKALKDESFALGQRRIEEATDIIGGAIKGKKGKVVRMPFRFLTAGDAFYRTANKQGSLSVLATRKAIKEGLSGPKMVKRVDDLIKNPTNEMIKLAEKEAKRLIFQEDLSGTLEALDGLRQQVPWAKLVVPFFKTPVNILKAVIQRTPLAPLSSSTRKALKAGGGEAADAFSRMVVGSSILTAFTLYAMEGKITGRGPKNKPERDALRRQGWQPYALKIGDKFYSYRGYEPLTGYLGLAADVAETFETPSDDTALRTISAIAGDFLDQPFLTGVSDILDALTDPNANPSKVAGNFIAGATIPTGISHIARSVDPVYRKPSGVLQTLESRIPFMSKKVLPHRNVFGEASTRGGTTASRFSSPTFITQETQNAVESELDRLNFTVGFPGKTAFGKGLSNEEYDALLRVSGGVIKNVLENVFATEVYQSATENKKEKIIEKVVRDTRTKVKEKLFKEKRLLREIEKRLEKKGVNTERAKEIAPEIYSQLLQSR